MEKLMCFCVPKNKALQSYLNSKIIRKFLDHLTFLVVIFVLIPVYFYFGVFVLLPYIVKDKLWWSVHQTFAIFLLFNIVSNMMCGKFTDSTIKGKFLHHKEEPDWTLCTVCETVRPPRSWHCNHCNICVLRRDHHCVFFACCIGYFNYRYFYMFMLHIFIAMLYSFVYSVQLIFQFIQWKNVFTVLKFVLPFVNLIFDRSDENILICFTVVNLIYGVFSGFLFIYHTKNLLQGITSGEMKKNHCSRNRYDFGYKKNVIDVLGHRWYLVWLSPFVSSPLPGNGISWNDKKS